MSQGLIIQGKWGDKILDEGKWWEIRSSDTSKRGKFELVYSGTNYRFGSFVLVDSIYVPRSEFWDHYDKHKIKPGEFDINSYAKIYAWVLAEVVKYEKPIPYEKKRGPVIWVNL